METLANLESFVRSAECNSFSGAARRLALTPAAISRNVAQLERNLGVQLFQRSTRGLTLTEAGERFLHSVRGGLDGIQAAIAEITTKAGLAAGVLKISAAPGFGRDYLLPLMPAFLAQHPAVLPDWHLDNRQVDLIVEGFDVAIGGGIELADGVVARELAPAHVIAVASATYLQGKPWPQQPDALSEWEGILMRSATSGRVKQQVMRNAQGAEAVLALQPRMTVNDPEAVCQSVLAGLGVGLLAIPHALPHLESGVLVRLLPDWHVDAGTIWLYFTSQKLLPAKTRAFVDFVTTHFRERKLAQRFSAR